MNFGDLDSRSAQHDNRSRRQRSPTRDYDLPVTPLKARLAADHSPSITSSISDPATVVPWQTPRESPQRSPKPHPAPQLPPFRTPHRSPESSLETLRPTRHKNAKPIGVNESAYVSNTPLVVRFDEEQLKSNQATASRGERMNDLESNPPTPVDDTPYIRFALDQLTREEDVRDLQRPATAASTDSYPVKRVIPDYGLGYVTPDEAGTVSPAREREGLALVRKHRSSPRATEERLFAFNPTKPLSYHSEHAQLPSAPSPVPLNLSLYLPVDPPLNSKRHPNLTFVPKILRPTSMITLSCLCLAMVALIMFCAIFSSYHDSLLSWSGGIYGPRYFLFGFFPQILAALIFIYVQGVMSAITRIMPFTTMAMSDAHKRSNALFMKMYLRTLLCPKWTGVIGVDIATFCLWLSVWTIPLQSCLFSVVQIDGVWRWTAVQGIAWTLVAIYILILIGVVIAGLYFFRRRTGLMWDPRSLADVITLLPRSNSLKGFSGTGIMRSKEDIRIKLGLRTDRLGYWRTPNQNQGIFYCIGEEGASTRQYTLESGRHETGFTFGQFADTEKGAAIYSRETRYRFIPWYLRDTFIIFWSVAASIFLLALFIISFLPSTAIRKGFPAHVPVVPDANGFSAANFLYSFIPSLLGMLLYLFFQTLDMDLRILKPWSELSRIEGSPASHSLLLDYPALLPVSITLKALANSHYRIALTSLFSTLFILLPILAGGLFFPLTTPSSTVRMIPSLPAYYIILTLLILYLIGLLSMIPNRYSMHLPHGATCLAEIISWVHDSEMLDDASFSAPRTKADLGTRLMAEKTRGGGVNRYSFGVFRGKSGGEFLGVDRVGRKLGAASGVAGMVFDGGR